VPLMSAVSAATKDGIRYACRTDPKPPMMPASAVECDSRCSGCRTLLANAPGEHRHFPGRLLVAFALGDLDAAVIHGKRVVVSAALRQRASEKLPSGGEIGIERDRLLEVARGIGRIGDFQIFAAEAEAQQRAV